MLKIGDLECFFLGEKFLLWNDIDLNGGEVDCLCFKYWILKTFVDCSRIINELDSLKIRDLIQKVKSQHVGSCIRNVDFDQIQNLNKRIIIVTLNSQSWIAFVDRQIWTRYFDIQMYRLGFCTVYMYDTSLRKLVSSSR